MARHNTHAIRGLPYFLLYLMPALLAVEYRVRFTGWSFALAELCFVIAAMVSALAWASASRVALPKALPIAVLTMGSTAFISVLLQSDIKHNLSVYRDLMLPVLFYGALIGFRMLPAQALRLAKAFIVYATLSSALAILQFFTNDYLWFQSEDTAAWQPLKSSLAAQSVLGQMLGVSETLPVGFCSHPNNFASYVVIPALLAYALARTAGPVRRWFWGFCLLVQTAAVVCTFSRSSFLTLLGGVVAFELIVARKKRPHALLITTTAALIAGLVIVAVNTDLFAFDDLGTLFGRFDMLQSSVSLLGEHPIALLTGGLTESYMNVFYFYNQLVHNLFAYLILQFGIATMVAWVMLVGSEIRRIGQGMRQAASFHQRTGGAILVGVTLSIFFYGQTYSMLDSVQIGLWLLFWLGVSSHILQPDQTAATADRNSRLHSRLRSTPGGAPGTTSLSF